MRWADDRWPMRRLDDVWLMQWAYDAVYSWLGDPLRTRRRDKLSCSGWSGHSADVCCRVERHRLRPKGATTSSKSEFGRDPWVPRLHTTVSLVSRLNGWSLPRRGGRPAPWETHGRSDMTLMCDADHVIYREIRVSCFGKLCSAAKTPRQFGISRGPARPLPNGSHFVTIS
jgi:hypothetical protein